MTTEENEKKTGQEDPRPLTTEEFDELKKKEKRTGGIISTIVDFFTGFFTVTQGHRFHARLTCS